MRPAARVLPLIEAAAAQLDAAGITAENGLGQGTLSTFDEAAWLVLWALGLPLESNLQDIGQQPVAAQDAERLQGLLRQRIEQRTPTAYLTRQAWLCGVPFYVDERVIIPRSFIAELMTEGTLDTWLSADTNRVLDLCTGNCSLAIIAALTYPDVQIEAADISADALAVARINVDQHRLSERITLIESDGLQRCAGPYDLLICNPPYVNADSMARLPAEFRAEPSLALAGGGDGMDFVRQLLAQAASRLNQQGVLVLEIGNERESFERAFPTLAPIWLPTSAGDEQVLLLTHEQLS
jgi:ribosomal protein L3 glutamine methyltransferase